MWPANRELADFPDDDRPFQTMMRGWLTFLIPIACLAWVHTKSLLVTSGAFFAPPAIAILQGTIGIVRYRLNFGDAPLPQSPAHGVVVVHPDDLVMSASSCTINDNDDQHHHHHESHLGCSCLGGRRWRNTTQMTDQDRFLLNKALQDPPLRLLVIGDSLAIGVGTSRSCTPLLPEVIARTLSKALGGRAVYWTCHGAPGASAGWIVRELERGVSHMQTSIRQSETKIPRCAPIELNQTVLISSAEDSDTSSSSSSSLSDDNHDDEIDNDYDDDELDQFKEWRDRLRSHRKGFDPDFLGPYDIAVVLTGSNDLKSAVFPFLLTGEDIEFRKQARERGGSYAMELRRVLDVLRQRMKYKIDRVRDNVLERIHLNVSPRSRSMDHEQQQQQQQDAVAGTDAFILPDSFQDSSLRRPMVVLPGMPARALPIFGAVPLRWLAIPIVAMMDNHKRSLALSHPGEVMFVNAPTIKSITEFEAQRGPLWEKRRKEDTILALRDIRRRDCEQIEREMRDYYRRKGNDDNPVTDLDVVLQYNPPVPPLSERPGRPGSKIFSVDNVHPTDEGYDFWGRHIADAIVAEWNKQQ